MRTVGLVAAKGNRLVFIRGIEIVPAAAVKKETFAGDDPRLLVNIVVLPRDAPGNQKEEEEP